MLVFEKRGKLKYPEKNLLEQRREPPKTQPTYDAGSANQTRDTLVGRERSRLCAIPAPQRFFTLFIFSSLGIQGPLKNQICDLNSLLKYLYYHLSHCNANETEMGYYKSQAIV